MCVLEDGVGGVTCADPGEHWLPRVQLKPHFFWKAPLTTWHPGSCPSLNEPLLCVVPRAMLDYATCCVRN